MLTTTAISYTNGKPHIGHLYELILADYYARKEHTLLLTGTDEHGKKIEQIAVANGESPYTLCSRNSTFFRSLADTAQVSYARFIRTTDEDHKAFVKECIIKAYTKGDIYLSSYEGWYNIREETYMNEMDAKITDYKDPVSGIPYEKISEPAYFFRLSKYQNEILAALKTIRIEPENALSAYEERLHNLKDICISRSTFSWGIPFPIDESHVVYVWFDALLNYVSGANSLGTTRAHHVIGKDITWFHTAIYLGILYSCDLKARIPERITVHGFVTDENGIKMSKSLGNVVDVDSLLTLPIEAIRFYFLYRTKLTGDFHYSRDDLINTYNGILVKQFGNLVQRILTLAKPVEADINRAIQGIDISERLEKVREATYPLTEHFAEIQQRLAEANADIQAKKPWGTTGEERAKLLIPNIVLLLELFELLVPIIPEKIKELQSYFGWDGALFHLTPEKKRAFIVI